MRRINFEEKINSCILDEKINKTPIRGFVKPEVFKILRENSSIGKVPRGMEYRPDKIAEYYYGNSSFSWIIDFANHFTEGIKEYRLGREILIPNYNIVQSELSSYIES